MTQYDLHGLDPMAFQTLVNDLVAVRDGLALRYGREGPDGGVDGLYLDPERKIVVQAKRWGGTFAALLRGLVRDELPKVRALAPTRYILGISLPISAGERRRLMGSMEGHLRREEDILDLRDLNDLLRRPEYRWVVRAHPALWSHSADVLEEVLGKKLHQALYQESAFELGRALKERHTFVPTRLYRQLSRQLEEEHVVILSGDPGIGKTTMAYMLALSCLDPAHPEGFLWVRSIEAIHALLAPDLPQVFLLDDFWGSIFYQGDHARRSEAERFKRLLSDLLARENVRVIFTTREYVLQAGIQDYPGLGAFFARNKLLCTLTEYSLAERAEIFFRHLHAARLPRAHVEWLYYHCETIITSEDYSPRVLAQFLTQGTEGEEPWEYEEDLLEYLAAPYTFWEEIFQELPEEVRFLAMLILLGGDDFPLHLLKDCYERYLLCLPDARGVKTYPECLALLEQSLVRTESGGRPDRLSVRFVSPAAMDFLTEYLRERLCHYAPMLLRCISDFWQAARYLDYFGEDEEDGPTLLAAERVMELYEDGVGQWRVADMLDILARACLSGRCPRLQAFVEERTRRFCEQVMDLEEDIEEWELTELHFLLFRCAALGIALPARELIEAFYQRAVGLDLLEALTKLREVYPGDYADFWTAHGAQVQNEAIEWLLELLSDVERDEAQAILEEVPETLATFEMPLTEELRDRLSEAAKMPFLTGPDSVRNTRHRAPLTDEERELDEVVEQAGGLLLGEVPAPPGVEEIEEAIGAADLPNAAEAALRAAVVVGGPWYLDHMLQTRAGLDLALLALSFPQALSAGASGFMTALVHRISQVTGAELDKLIHFCTEVGSMFLLERQPVLAEDALRREPIWQEVAGAPALEKAVTSYLVRLDGTWAWFDEPLPYICCIVGLVLTQDDPDSALSFSALPQLIGSIQDPGMLALFCRMLEEVSPEPFHRNCLAPALEKLMGHFSDEEDRAAALMRAVGLGAVYSAQGESLDYEYHVSQALVILRALGLSKTGDLLPEQLSPQTMEFLTEHHQPDDQGRFVLSTAQLADPSWRRALEMEEALQEYLEGLDFLVEQFRRGDFGRLFPGDPKTDSCW